MSKTTTQSNTPWQPAQKYLVQNLQDTKNTFDANQPKLQGAATQMQNTYNQLAPGAAQGIMGAQSLVNHNLAGDNLNGNPYLDKMIGQTNQNITDSVNGQFEQSGRYGSGANQGILAREIGNADNSMRFQNYGAERGYQQNAIGDSQNLMGGATGLLNNSAELPWVGTTAQNGGTTNLSRGYGTQTQTTSDPMGTVTGLAGVGMKAYSTFSDARLKDVQQVVGHTPDGLPLVNYTYKGDDTPQTGVLAQDVAQVRPDALGPTSPDGMMSVDYGKLGLPDPTTMASMMHPDAITPQNLPDLKESSTSLDSAPPAPTGLLSASDQITPQTLPTVKAPPSWMDKFMTPDASTTQGKFGILGDYLMAADGSPFQGLGKGLLASRADADKQASAQTEMALKRAQIMLEMRNASKPTMNTVNNSLISTDADGNSTVAYNGGPKQAELPAGIVADPTTGGYKALPGFETPADKAARESSDASDKSDRSDARQAKMFAHSDAAQAAGFAHSDTAQGRMIAAVAGRQQAAANAFSPGSIQNMAQQVIATGAYPPGVSRSPAVMARLSNEVTSQLQALGLNGKDLAAAQLAFTGGKAAARTVGSIGGKVDYGVNEFNAAAPLALASSAALPRGSFVPFNQVSQAFQRGNGNPALKDFQVKTQAAMNAYNLIASRSGTSMAERDNNNHLLMTADSPQAYAAAINGMGVEGKVTQNASRLTMNGIAGGSQQPANNNVPANIAAILAKHGAR